MIADNYILHIASWFPNDEDPFEGDFVERHIQCISISKPGVVYFTKPLEKPFTGLKKEEKENYIVYRRSYKRSHALSNYSKAHALCRKDLLSILRSHGKPIAVHCHASYPGLSIAEYISSELKVPFIFTEHSTIYMQQDLSIKERIILKYIKKYTPKTDYLIAVSQDHLKHMQSHVKFDKGMVIPNVVSDAFYETKIKKNKTGKRLIHISSMDDDQKNVTGIIKAFNAIQDPELSLTLVSSVGPKKAKYLMKKSGINDSRIKILGPCSHNEIADHMSNHDIMVLWSRYESFSLVIAEAWASGLYVLSSKCGGLSEEIQPSNGLLVTDYQDSALSASIQSAISNYPNIDGTSIRDYARSRFHSSAIREAYMDVYLGRLTEV